MTASPDQASVGRKSFHFLAGLLSGLTSSILLQPADLLKTRLQQSGSQSLSITLDSIFASQQPIRNLWRGTIPSAIRTGIGSALYFGCLDGLRGAVLAHPGVGGVVGMPSYPPADKNNRGAGNPKPRLSNAANLLTGALARAAAGFVMMPISVIKVRYESSLYRYTSLRHAALDIAGSSNGWRGFFAGSGATAARDAPYAGLYVLFYEAGKRRLHAGLGSTPTHVQPTRSAVGINFASATIAAGLATAITNPFDAIKTRLQLQPARYGNMLTAGRIIIGSDGWRSLFDGLGLRMARKGMSSALAWTLYEELVRRAELQLLTETQSLV